MKEITTAKGTYLFVEVPETLIDDRYFTLWSDKENSFIIEFQCEVGDLYCSLGTKNSCQVISTTNQITEEQAESIVFNHIVDDTKYYSNYLPYNAIDFRDVIDNSFETAKESLQSLIKANGLDEAKNYIILKKKL